VILLFNTDAPTRDRKPNIDGAVSRRLIWLKNFEFIGWTCWALDLRLGCLQLFAAFGSAADLWVAMHSAATPTPQPATPAEGTT
jgi:hypothetical protein